MALSIPSPQSVYRGNYASLPAATLKPPVEGNRTIPVNIGWAASGLSPNYCVEFNARHQQTLAINQISAIHVDNSKCSSSMHIAFLDTQFEILIGPNAVGFYPVVTNSLEFFAWIDLQPSPQDTTILQVLNFLPPPILFGTQLGGSTVGTVREVDTAAPIVGGPITDQGTIGLSTPLAINFGGTGGTTGNAALDNLSSSSGATTGSLVRSGTGIWSVTAAGSGTITGVTPGNGLQGGGSSGTVSLALSVPVSVANGGTGAVAGNAALDSLSGQSGANAGVLQRSSGGNWSTLLPLPLALGSGGTGASGAAAALTNLGAAPLASPVFTGTPNLPTGTVVVTQTAGNSTTAPASTAFVQNAVTAAPFLPLAGGTLSGPLTGTTASFTTNTTPVSGAGGFNFGASSNGLLYPYTASGWQLHTNGQAAGYALSVQQSSDPALNFSAPTATVLMSIASTGNMVISGTLTQGSDRNLKKDIAELLDGVGLIKRLLPKSYKRRSFDSDIASDEPKEEWGFIAQDVAEVIPAAVGTSSGEKPYMTLDITAIVATLVNAVKELTVRLETLEGKA